MKFFDLLHTAFLNLWRRKLRAILTVLGLVVGITSIVVMVSLGLGIEKATIDAYAGAGSLTVIDVQSWKYNEGTGQSSEQKLDDASVTAFEQLPGVQAVMPMLNIWGMTTSGKYYADLQILGVDAQTAEAFGFTLAEGRMPTYRRGARSYEIVFGAYVLQQFYNPKNWTLALDREGNPLLTMDSRFRLTFDWMNVYGSQGMELGEDYSPGKFYRLDLVGVASETNYNYAYYSLMAKDAVLQLMKENKNFIGQQDGYYNVQVKCASLDDVEAVRQAIDDMGYGTYSALDMVKQAQEQTRMIRLVLGAIGGVALFVAAIGIMNTMMMSIYERTKEIGIIKVLGCRMWNIVMLFLMEALLIGFFGGLFGLGLSFGASNLINMLMASGMDGMGVAFQSIIPMYLAVGGVLFSMAVALASGLYPAIRAMRLSALAAIRNE